MQGISEPTDYRQKILNSILYMYINEHKYSRMLYIATNFCLTRILHSNESVSEINEDHFVL